MQFKSVLRSLGLLLRWRSLGVHLLLVAWLAGTGYAMWVLSPSSVARLDVCQATAPR
jgi:hypothetical protein